jgi:hypothetical protein
MDHLHFGLRASLFDACGASVGFAHVAAPLEPGDLVALETGRPLRVVSVVLLHPDSPVQALAVVEPVSAVGGE